IRRLRKAHTSGIATEEFTYDLLGCGCLAGSTLTLDAFPKNSFTVQYDYDEVDRVKSVHYPARYSNASKAVTPMLNYFYSNEGSLERVELDGAVLADETSYNVDVNLTNLRL